MSYGRTPCYVSFRTSGDGEWQHNTEADSLFEGAMRAIRWFNEWHGPRPACGTILTVRAGSATKEREYRVRAIRVVEHFGLNPSDWLDD
jgi:hypothetical protein